MESVSIEKDAEYKSWICHITDLSDDLKDEIRNRLSSICHGESSEGSSSRMHTYRETLKEFCKRYDSKTTKTKKGMIGELLSHLIILRELPNVRTVSPYFNMEEGSIKKGFDLVLFDSANDDVWITEVKSGGVGSKKSNSKNTALLNTAKNDLKTRLNENETTIWINAINGARLAIKKGNLKKRITDILNDCLDEVYDSSSSSKSKDVLLVSVLYNTFSDKISIDKATKKRKKIENEELFRNIITFSFQKQTYQKIAAFLRSEASQ